MIHRDGPLAAAVCPQVTVKLAPAKDREVKVLIKALVGTKTSAHYHVCNLDIALPKFCMYIAAEPSLAPPTPQSNVSFRVQSTKERFSAWAHSRCAAAPLAAFWHPFFPNLAIIDTNKLQTVLSHLV